MINQELLDMLCCPETKADLILHNEYLVSADRNSRRCYRIEKDIPILLIEESQILPIEEWEQIMKESNKSLFKA